MLLRVQGIDNYKPLMLKNLIFKDNQAHSPYPTSDRYNS